MKQVHYRNGERTFILNRFTNTTMAKDTNVQTRIPRHITEQMIFVFSWNRYKEERYVLDVFNSLLKELSRLKNLDQTKNIQLAQSHLCDRINKLFGY